MNTQSAIVLHVPPFREIPGTDGRRVGMGDAMSAADDGLVQLAPMQKLIDSARGVEGVDPAAVSDADAAMTALTTDLLSIKTAGPTDVFAAPSKFNGPSFLAGLGLALAVSGLLYLALENSNSYRRTA